MGLSRRRFTREFKLNALRRLEMGVPIAELARAIEVNPITLLSLAKRALGRSGQGVSRGRGRRAGRRAGSRSWNARWDNRLYLSLLCNRPTAQINQPNPNPLSPSINRAARRRRSIAQRLLARAEGTLDAVLLDTFRFSPVSTTETRRETRGGSAYEGRRSSGSADAVSYSRCSS